MKLVFDNNSITIDSKTCDLEKFDEKSFFLVLEEIVKNKNQIEIEKHTNMTPLCTRLYEIISAEIEEESDDLD